MRKDCGYKSTSTRASLRQNLDHVTPLSMNKRFLNNFCLNVGNWPIYEYVSVCMCTCYSEREIGEAETKGEWEEGEIDKSGTRKCGKENKRERKRASVKEKDRMKSRAWTTTWF